MRLVIGGGAGNDPAVAAKTAELRKAFDEGVAQSRAGQYDASIESFNKALAVNPNCQDCLYNIGYAYAQKKELEKAEENYKKAILVKPDYAEAYNGLANVYNAQRKFDEAAAASAKANELTAVRARRPRGRQRRLALQPGRHPLEFRQDSGCEEDVRAGDRGECRTTPSRTTSSRWRS